MGIKEDSTHKALIAVPQIRCEDTEAGYHLVLLGPEPVNFVQHEGCSCAFRGSS